MGTHLNSKISIAELWPGFNKSIPELRVDSLDTHHIPELEGKVSGLIFSLAA